MTEKMDEIYEKDKEENKEFDEAVSGGSLEDLREGVKIRQKQNLNPIDTLNTLAKTWDKDRQSYIDTGAQLIDTAVTSSLEKLNVPGAQFIGDRARNISGFTADMLYPESWELPFYAAAAGPALAEPTVFGERLVGLKYGSGVASRVYRAAKPIIKSPVKHLANMVDDVWAQRRVFAPNAAGVGPLTGNWAVNVSDDLGQSAAKPLMSKGDQYVQGKLPVERFQSVPYQKKVTSAMNEFGMSGGGFDLRTYNLRKSLKTPTQRRVFLEHYLSPDFIKGRFSGFDKANRPGFAQKWADFLKAKGLDPVGDIQIHHINPLHDSIHLFDGIKFNSKEYWDVIETLIDANARTGVIHRGEDVQNLMMTLGKGKAVDTPHGIAHKYLNRITPTFFSKAEMKLMKKNPAYRIQKAEEWAKIVNKSEQVILEGHKQWSLLNPKLANELPFEKFNSELVNRLTKYTDQGYSKLIDPNFQLSDFNNIIQEILTTPGKRGPKTNYLKKIEKLGEKQGIHFDSETGTGTIQGDLFDQ